MPNIRNGLYEAAVNAMISLFFWRQAMGSLFAIMRLSVPSFYFLRNPDKSIMWFVICSVHPQGQKNGRAFLYS